MKQVYVSLIADFLHAGHIKILREATKFGEVTVGLLSTSAIRELNDEVYLKFDQRHEVVNNLALVSLVIVQNTASYRENLLKLKPDYVVHGDDWVCNHQSVYREEVISLLAGWSGELIEVPYSAEISDQSIKDQLHRLGITTVTRQQRLRLLINTKNIVKVLETHNALSGLIVESVTTERKGQTVSFDAMWSSSLTDSTIRGKPDIEAVDMSSRLNTVHDIFEVTTKPMIFDADTGGKIEHFEFTVKSLERIGVSAVIIEDKTGLKKNSLFGNDVLQIQDDIDHFCEKIKRGKSAQVSDDFMIISRIESLILGKGIDDALLRANAYIQAGADGIMIHSRQTDGYEIKEFIKRFRSGNKQTPIVVVPTSYNSVPIEEFIEMGVNVVIYANHLLRAAYPAMLNVAQLILENGRTKEIEKDCMPIPDILNFITGTK